MDIFFPYETMRQFQGDLIKDITRCIKEGKNLIAHAPTGSGKTSSVFSACLPQVLSNKDTLIFITPRHTQHVLAINTLKEIKKKFNLDFIGVDLIGKKNLCSLGGMQGLSSGEFSEYCKQMVDKGQCEHYTNTVSKGQSTVLAKKVLKETEKFILHAEEFRAICAKNNLCPYEMACLLGKKARVIVADYFHFLNTRIGDTLLKKMGKEDGGLILIIDEAHNLLDRTRELMSAKISTLTLERARKEASLVSSKHVSEKVVQVREALEVLVRNKTSIEQREALVSKKEFYDLLDFDLKGFINELKEVVKKVVETKKVSYCSSLADFLQSWGGPDDSYARILKTGFLDKGGSYISLEYQCMDPALILKPLSLEVKSMIMMSGTLSPAEVYRDLFGVEAECKEYASPFPVQNKLTLIVPETTTKFTNRGEEMFKKISKKCSEIANVVPGNSIIFFPSYYLRDKIYNYFREDCNKTVFLEANKMDKFERTNMLDRFREYKKTGAVLLGVASGSFGEGIDLMGDDLKAVIVVGLPLAKPDLETREVINYYNKKFGKGWHYGYTLPALVKCFQNAGRCIRSETDRGVVVFLDERYAWDSYFSCFPKGEYLRIIKDPVERIKDFFKEQPL